MTLRFGNVPVVISFWFAAVITLMLMFFPQSRAAECILLCILHECGHLLSMFIFGNVPKKIQLGYFGMKIVTGGRLLSPKKEIVIAASGPLANLTWAAILHFCGCKDIAAVSLGLGIFNLLPVPALDGGRILGQLVTNEKLLKSVGFIFCAALLLLGIAAAFYTKRNLTILVVSLYLFLGMFTAS